MKGLDIEDSLKRENQGIYMGKNLGLLLEDFSQRRKGLDFIISVANFSNCTYPWLVRKKKVGYFFLSGQIII